MKSSIRDDLSYYSKRHNLVYEYRKFWERMLIKFVWLLPRKVVYWGTIRVGVHATQGKYSSQIVPDLTLMDALQRWEGNNENEN